jgi:hypothetical protein
MSTTTLMHHTNKDDSRASRHVKVAVAVRVEVVLSHVKWFLINLELNFSNEQVSTKVFVVAAAVKKAIQNEMLE